MTSCVDLPRKLLVRKVRAFTNARASRMRVNRKNRIQSRSEVRECGELSRQLEEPLDKGPKGPSPVTAVKKKSDGVKPGKPEPVRYWTPASRVRFSNRMAAWRNNKKENLGTVLPREPAKRCRLWVSRWGVSVPHVPFHELALPDCTRRPAPTDNVREYTREVQKVGIDWNFNPNVKRSFRQVAGVRPRREENPPPAWGGGFTTFAEKEKILNPKGYPKTETSSAGTNRGARVPATEESPRTSSSKENARARRSERRRKAAKERGP